MDNNKQFWDRCARFFSVYAAVFLIRNKNSCHVKTMRKEVLILRCTGSFSPGTRGRRERIDKF